MENEFPSFAVDDPLDAFPVHFGGGLWGLIAVALLGRDGIILSFGTYESLQVSPRRRSLLGGGADEVGISTMNMSYVDPSGFGMEHGGGVGHRRLGRLSLHRPLRGSQVRRALAGLRRDGDSR